jgi:quercetin dioxygenase-like cupin family protein
MARWTMLGCALAMALAGDAPAQTRPMHKVVDAASTQWGPGPAGLRPGAKAALLYGDPTKAELFVMRLWLPKGFRVAPHTHPRPEILTVISGRFQLGTGRTANRARTRTLTAGSFSALGPDMPHYAFTDRDTVIQISTTGPWAVNYLNPADDPRRRR